MKGLLCWLFRHRVVGYSWRLVDKSEEHRVEAECCRCGALLIAPYALAFKAKILWPRR